MVVSSAMLDRTLPIANRSSRQRQCRRIPLRHAARTCLLLHIRAHKETTPFAHLHQLQQLAASPQAQQACFRTWKPYLTLDKYCSPAPDAAACRLAAGPAAPPSRSPRAPGADLPSRPWSAPRDACNSVVSGRHHARCADRIACTCICSAG